MPRRYLCAGCIERVATERVLFDDDTEGLPVCSKACAYELAQIGPAIKRAADDSADEVRPAPALEKLIAADIAGLSMVLTRVTKVQLRVYNDFSTEAGKIRAATALIGDEMMSASTFLEKLITLRNHIIAAIDNASKGRPPNMPFINGQYMTIFNQLADDIVMERYLETISPSDQRSNLPWIYQRLAARRSFPIQIVANIRWLAARGAQVIDFAIAYRRLFAVFKLTAIVFVMQCSCRGDDISMGATDTPWIPGASTILVVNKRATISVTSLPDNIRLIANDEHNNRWYADSTGNNIMRKAPDGSPVVVVASVDALLPRIVAIPLDQIPRRCAVHDGLIAVYADDGIYMFDSNTNREWIIAPMVHSQPTAVLIDWMKRVWAVNGTTLSVYTTDGALVVADVGILPRLNYGSNAMLRKDKLTVWISYTRNDAPVDAFAAFRWTPENLS